MPRARSRSATNAMSESNTRRISSPTKWMSAARSSLPASCCETAFTVAISAARLRVSSSRRAFSRATVMLVARVFSRRRSASVKACSRWMSTSSSIPRTSSPTIIGT